MDGVTAAPLAQLADKSLVALFFAAFLLGAYHLAKHAISTVLRPMAEGALGVVRDLDASIKALNSTIATTTREHDAAMSDRHREIDRTAQARHDAIRALIVDAHKELAALLTDYMQRTNTSLAELRDALRDVLPGERFPSSVGLAAPATRTARPAVEQTVRSRDPR